MKEDSNWKNVQEAMIHKQHNSDNIINYDEGLNLGLYYSSMFVQQSRHVLFTLSRYKFVCQLMRYRDRVKVLELGCQEAMGSLLLAQNTRLEGYTGIDFDHNAITWNQAHFPSNFVFIEEDFFKCSNIDGAPFDLVFSLDVIEHIDKKNEDQFCRVMCNNLKNDGVVVVGTPSIYMSPYACEESKIGHVNLFDQKRLYKLMSRYFNNVFIFNMNDEVVHTGFDQMSCYMFAVCTGKRAENRTTIAT